MIALIDPCKRGELHFQFLNGYSLFCSVFVASGFLGQPVETAEATPFWFDRQSLPLDEMWEDDRLWLPRMLDGESFSGFFVFDGEKMVNDFGRFRTVFC